jgi:hypothetical protein
MRLATEAWWYALVDETRNRAYVLIHETHDWGHALAHDYMYVYEAKIEICKVLRLDHTSTQVPWYHDSTWFSNYLHPQNRKTTVWRGEQVQCVLAYIYMYEAKIEIFKVLRLDHTSTPVSWYHDLTCISTSLRPENRKTTIWILSINFFTSHTYFSLSTFVCHSSNFPHQHCSAFWKVFKCNE